MLHSTDHILTSHAGSLPRTPELIAANRAKERGETAGFNDRLTAAVDDIVARQHAIGISVPNDGEYGKSMSTAVDYGSWWSYSFDRLSGLELDYDAAAFVEHQYSTPGHTVLTGFAHRRDRARFAEAYSDPESGIYTGNPERVFPKIVGPLHYVGQDAVASDIKNLKHALAANNVEEGFLTALSPSSASRITNEYYKTDEELLWACADALREEYLAIVDAGLILQIDDPSIAENFDQIEPEPSVEDYRNFTKVRIDALNYALRGIPQDRIRFHLCWGSWHGPHTTDFEFKNLADLMLQINAGGYSFEAGNVRHEHEWKVWQDVKLPDDKVILPGVVSHATNVVEHPELVAQRIERFTSIVGKERVIASTDCGFGGRIHPQIAVAKLESLVAGANIASQELWNTPTVVGI